MNKLSYRQKIEKKIGRKLLSTEIIHHKDGNQHNDTLKNLQIINGHSEHNKARVDVNWKEKLNHLMQKHPIKKVPITEVLSVFFTNRQQQILYRKLVKLQLSKTEKEYYSRVIKPKLKGIIYTPLQEIAQQIVWESF